jgi:ATP-dependent helicase HrpB
VDWAEQVSRALTWPQRETLAREAPDKLEVPSGSFIRLDYQAEGPPILAARIQELFGLADTPKLAGGRVGVVMHLLAPNYRPQQVTQDLRSFWDKTYQEVRRELRQRYPKHSWPDDPWTAPPQRRPGRPRG